MRISSSIAERRECSTAFPEAFDMLMSALGAGNQGKLLQLWQQWETVLGPELAGLAFPLGHKNTILLLGAEDSMAMQEITLQSQDIVAQANEFMGEESFTGVRTTLLQGERHLAQERPRTQLAPFDKHQLPPPPEKLGSLVSTMDSSSPVGRCYMAYLKLYGIGDQRGESHDNTTLPAPEQGY